MGLWCWFAIGCAWYRLIFLLLFIHKAPLPITTPNLWYDSFIVCLFIVHIISLQSLAYSSWCVQCPSLKKTLVKMQHYCQTHSVHKNIVILLEIISSQEPRWWFSMSHICKGVWIPYPPRVFDRFQCSPDNDIIYESIEVKALCKSKMDSTSLKWSTYKT